MFVEEIACLVLPYSEKVISPTIIAAVTRVCTARYALCAPATGRTTTLEEGDDISWLGGHVAYAHLRLTDELRYT
ncbi:hypothetical protein GCM10022249_23380 [Enteractinococcus coprophilus]